MRSPSCSPGDSPSGSQSSSPSGQLGPANRQSETPRADESRDGEKERDETQEEQVISPTGETGEDSQLYASRDREERKEEDLNGEMSEECQLSELKDREKGVHGKEENRFICLSE